MALCKQFSSILSPKQAQERAEQYKRGTGQKCKRVGSRNRRAPRPHLLQIPLGGAFSDWVTEP